MKGTEHVSLDVDARHSALNVDVLSRLITAILPFGTERERFLIKACNL